MEKKKVKTSKLRISVPLSEELYNKVVQDASAVGVSLPTYMAMIVGNHYKAQQMSLDYAKDYMADMFSELLKQYNKNVTADEVRKELDNGQAEDRANATQLLNKLNIK